MADLPSIASSSYTVSSSDLLLRDVKQAFDDEEEEDLPRKAKERRLIANAGFAAAAPPHVLAQRVPIPFPEATVSLRIVKVFIADPNENLAIDKHLLFTSDEKFTDLTDQELFFEVPIQDLLTKHNEYRAGVIDKKQSEKFGREIKLEPIKIRDLKMVVVNIAQF